MNILPEDFELTRYGLHCRLVREGDAEFITMLREDERLSHFVHQVEGGAAEQKKWIQRYKEREKKGEEYYFIFLEDDIPMGVYRIYNIQIDSVTIGSWMFRHDATPNSSIKADIIIKDFCFENFPNRRVFFDVRKQNHSVIRYHSRYQPLKIDENELDIQYELVYDGYVRGRDRMLELLEII